MKTQISISTKKGHTQLTTWTIVQEHPYPTAIDAHRMHWGNASQLFRQYGDSNPVDIGNAYRCELDRNAGPDGAPDLPIVLRSEDLGQITIHPLNSQCCCTRVKIKGYTNPSAAQRDWIAAQILPSLLEAIASNRDALRVEAVEGLRVHFQNKVADLRTDVNRLEAEAAAVMAQL